MTDTITLSVDEHDELVNAANFLTALEAAGVDNWEGYEVAKEMVKEFSK